MKTLVEFVEDCPKLLKNFINPLFTALIKVGVTDANEFLLVTAKSTCRLATTTMCRIRCATYASRRW